ncbi:TonB-dependent receptor plug [Pseudopedobacter saltans DSM 12145]|uniref:TonB-dependent receptor plug n=2 Tax=Pseudopedobacter saltans TaxID=151895 RepID=F0SCP3_PSESL|nr:TonB-dependent receptor plug [Pseudopedobacter saltans DSM 12145]
MKKVLLLLTLTVMSISVLFAQNRQITGTVKDDTGEPLPGVGVSVKGTTTGTQTNVDGKFSLSIPANASTLVFRYIGFKAKEIEVGTQTTFNVVLEQEATMLNEVVAIGYGTVKKGDLTGSVGIVKGEELTQRPVTNVAEALTGKVAGLQIVTTEGSPDADIKVRLRGGGSISQDNSPLYIVDGFPVNDISNIASSDIESITFLKDAASTAIYGSRAANGVLVITTKEGKAGKVNVTANVYAGFRNITKQLEVLNPYEYVRYQYEIDQGNTFKNYYGSFEDLEIYKSVKGSNWQEEIFGGTASQQYYNVGINGGSKESRYNLGLTRNKEESIMLGSGFERNNLNFKLNSELSKKVNIDFNTRLAYTIIDGAGVNQGSGSVTRLRNSVKYAPTKGLRGFDQSSLDDDDLVDAETASLLYNPVESVLDDYKKQYRFSNNLNLGLNWKITKELKFRSEGGYEFKNDRTDNVWGTATPDAKNYGGQPISRVTNLKGYSYRFSNYFTYDKVFNKIHSLNVVVGQETLSSGYKTVTNESRFYPLGMKTGEILANANFGTPIPTRTYISQDDRLSSYFGRANYTLKDKYLFTVTMRADGSSKFAEGNQWGYFPSAAFGWKISEEDFLKDQSDWLEQLKLRVSYGSTGNNRIPSNAWQLSYSTDNENKPYYPGEVEAPNFIPGSYLYNPKLKWETTINRNIGVDYSLFKGRINGAVDVYWNTTNDLLVQAPIAQSSGYSTQYQNYGSTSNKGVELTIDGYIVNNKDFKLSAAFNIGFNRNNVDQFRNGDVNYKAFTSGWNGTAQPLEDFLVREGNPVGQMYGYVTEGMYSFDDFTFDTASKIWKLNTGVPDNSSLTSAAYFGPGALKFKDISGPNGVPDGKIDQYDKAVIGNANPKHVGGLTLNAEYKGFDLQAAFNWTFGNNIYNANKIDFTNFLLSRKYQNLIADMSLENRFTIIDPITGYNVATGNNANPQRLAEINQNASIWSPLMTVTPLHSWAIEDGSFLRLNTLTLGYTLPKNVVKKMGIGKLRAYVTAYNVFVITNYSGYDPEVDTRRNPPVTPGVDYSAYPKSRSFVGGLNVSF